MTTNNIYIYMYSYNIYMYILHVYTCTCRFNPVQSNHRDGPVAHNNNIIAII